MKSRSENFFGPAVCVIAVIVALALAEVAARILDLAPQLHNFRIGQTGSSFQLSDNPILGYELKPNVRGEPRICHNSFPYTNSFGQRDIEREVQAKPGVKRILILGDSVVAGHGVCDLNQTISRKLESLYTDEKVEVLNFGVGGYCTKAEIELLKVKALQFRPDVVVLIFVENDYVDSNGDIMTYIKTPRPWIVERAFVSSDLFRWLSLRNNFYNLRQDLDPLARLSKNNAAIGDDNVAQGFSLLSHLRDAYKFKVVVALWPYFTDAEIFEPGQRIESGPAPLPVELLAYKYSLETVRLSTWFKNDYQEIVGRAKAARRRRTPSPRWIYTIGDGTHPSTYGAAQAAHALHKILQ